MEEKPKLERPIELEDEQKIGLTPEEKYRYTLERSAYAADVAQKLEAHVDALTTINGIDHLTGAVNRQEFDLRLAHALKLMRGEEAEKRAGEEKVEEVSLIAIDIDYFKSVNDTLGHHAGDEVLAKVADVLRHSIRKEDTVARYGGEEFFVLLHNLDENKAAEKAEEMRNAIEQTSFERYQGLKVTASFGVVSSSSSKESEELRIMADKAMYESKHTGRNCVTTYTDL
jgi:diguanylate cyclase (GGDEF)-like protein